MEKNEKILGIVHRKGDGELAGTKIFNWLWHNFQGKARYSDMCDRTDRVYFLNGVNEISSTAYQGIDEGRFLVMTLGEFEKKFPFKMGEVVYVKDTPYFGKITRMYWHVYRHTIMYRISHDEMHVEVPAPLVASVYKSY